MTDAEKLAVEQRIVEVLKTVYDPEIPVNIYDLGLIYRIELQPDATVEIDMTFTAPSCPAADFILEDFRTKVEGDVKMAATQSIQAVRNDIENLMVGKLTDSAVNASLADVEFIKEAIKAVAMNFNAQEAVDLEAVLPEALKGELEPFIKGELAGALKGGISASFSKKVSGGFNIGPKDGSYFISFTDETFRSLISEYLRPATRKILFGE